MAYPPASSLGTDMCSEVQTSRGYCCEQQQQPPQSSSRQQHFSQQQSCPQQVQHVSAVVVTGAVLALKNGNRVRAMDLNAMETSVNPLVTRGSMVHSRRVCVRIVGTRFCVLLSGTCSSRGAATSRLMNASRWSAPSGGDSRSRATRQTTGEPKLGGTFGRRARGTGA
jgi:hypothetical protein